MLIEIFIVCWIRKLFISADMQKMEPRVYLIPAVK